MRKYLFTILIVSLLSSCVKLAEERIALNEKGSIKGDSLEKVLVDPENGVHYVFVDTTDKELLIRYETEKVEANYVSALMTRLSEEDLLFVAIQDTVVQDSVPVIDTLIEAEAKAESDVETTSEQIVPPVSVEPDPEVSEEVSNEVVETIENDTIEIDTLK